MHTWYETTTDEETASLAAAFATSDLKGPMKPLPVEINTRCSEYKDDKVEVERKFNFCPKDDIQRSSISLTIPKHKTRL